MNLKSERGSVTIYVLSVTICVTLILLSIFVGMMNKNSSQYKQIEQIYNEYAGESNNEKIDNVYEDTINATNGQVQISAYFYKQSGEKYDLSEYTNESLTLKVSCSGGSNGEKAKITIGNKVVEYTSQGIIIDENCVIKIVYSGKQKTITVNGIDKTAPVKPTYVSRYADKTAYTSGTWTNKTAYTDITTEDKASGVAKIQYSFDNSTWRDLSLLASSGIQVSGTKATGTEEWTLKDRNNNVWFRAVDNVGNVSEASDVFNVKYDLTAPTASKTEVKNLTATGYDVYVYNVADAG